MLLIARGHKEREAVVLSNFIVLVGVGQTEAEDKTIWEIKETKQLDAAYD